MYILYLLNLLILVNADKFCINCKFFIKSTLCNNMFGRCAIFQTENNINNIDYLVYGRNNKEYKLCSEVRYDENLCGNNGKYYEEKFNFFPKKPNFCLIEKINCK